MSLFSDMLANHGGDRVAAATELARGLMEHDPSDPYRAGYSLENAILSAEDAFNLTYGESDDVRRRLTNVSEEA